jgi:hypothetical protein
MKRQTKIFTGIVLLGAIFVSCTKNSINENNTSLKQAVNKSAQNLNTAMTSISSSRAFGILTVNDGPLKSATIMDAAYRVYIPLDSIKGTYDYKPINKPDRWGWSLIRFFTKTANNAEMLVRMPLQKVSHPRSLWHYSPADSSLKNNFSIAVSAYHNNYNSYWDYDYLLNSQISVNDTVAGDLDIQSVVSHAKGIQYASQYAFSGGYAAQYKYNSGDTTVSSFSIMKGTDLLYQEKLLTIKNDTARFGRERQYILTVGNVKIIRTSGMKVQVYLNGVLQTNATVTIIDKENDSEPSVSKGRDIQITFDDATTTTLSALISSSVDNIKTLFNSLHSVYFAAYVVDWIAYDIYYHRN